MKDANREKKNKLYNKWNQRSKKGFFLTLTALLCIFCIACGSNGGGTSKETANTAGDTESAQAEETNAETEEESISDESVSDENDSDSKGIGFGRFVGSWSCEESYLEDKENATYTGFYALDIEKNGEFSLYDAEAGNPGIAGKMQIDSDTDLTVSCDEEDFDPPAGWYDMSQKQTLQYEFEGTDELHLIYTKGDETSTLVFHREEE